MKATLINSAGNKVAVESGSQQAQQYFSQGYKLDTTPTVAKTTTTNVKTPMITGYKDGVAVQVPKGAYVPGVSLTPPTKVNASTLTSTDNIDKITEEKIKNQTLAQQQETAGVNASIDTYSTQLNDLIKTIKDSGALSQTYTPEQQAQNKTDLLAKQGQIRDLGLQTTKAQSNVDFNPNLLTSQGSMSKQQIEREASFKQTALSNEEANLLSSVNLSAQEQQNIISGTSTISQYQDKIQSHIDSAKQSVLEQAKQLTADQQAKLATALDAYKGIDVDKLTAEQTATFSKIITDAGLDPQLVFQGIKAVNAQQTLDNNLKIAAQAEKVDNKPVKIGTDANGNDLFFDQVKKKVVTASELTSPGVVSDATGNSYDISSYATDPNHETAVANIVSNIGQFKSISDIDNYIKKVAPNSPITGQMIADSASKYGVSWEVMTAMMQQDSSLGTAGKGAKTFNPGNVGNTDSGATKNYGNWQSGVDAVAQWLSNHKKTTTPTTPTTQTIGKSEVTGKPLSQTELQSKTFADRLDQSNTIINNLESKFTGWESALANATFFGQQLLPEAFKTEDRKSIEQAERNFINAILRKESGAAISDSEFENARQQYFPQPGDTALNLAQKKTNRQTVIDGMRLAGGSLVSNTNKNLTDDEAYNEYLKTQKK